MDHEERCDRIETSTKSGRIRVVSESDSVIVKISEENADLRLQNDEFGLCKHQEMDSARGIGPASSRNDRSTENSGSLVEGNVLKNGVDASSEGLVEGNETRGVDEAYRQVDRRSEDSDNSVGGVVVDTQQAAYVNEDGTSSSEALAERESRKVPEKEDSCVIDMNGGASERVCRICHLNSEQSFECIDGMSSTAGVTDLIQLGCGCKDELGIAHIQCAEAWFKLKGNRMCEICGQIAKNVTGVRDNRFIEDWHEQGSISGDFISSDRGTGCWRRQPLCNFLMACLVIAFVLPWFFHVNMF